MKQSRSFEEAVNAALAEPGNAAKVIKKVKKEKPVEEAIGAGTYMPAGLNSTTQNAWNTRGGQNPPYSTYTSTAKQSVEASIQSPDETEAPKVTPYPLAEVTSFLADAYMNLRNVETQIDLSLKNPVVTEAQSKELQGVKNNIKTTLGNIKKIGELMGRITLD